MNLGLLNKPQSLPAPLQVSSAPLVAWWDYSDPNGDGSLPADLTFLSRVADKSGNGKHSTQANGSLQFQFLRSGINGKPAAYLDGSRGMIYPALGSFSKVTIFSVFVATAVPFALEHILGDDNYVTGSVVFLISNNRLINLYVFGRTPENGNSANGVVALGTPYVAMAKDNNTNSRILLNGTQVINTNISGAITKTMGPGYIGLWNNGGLQRFWTGFFGEHVIFGGELSTADELLMRQALGNKWGIDG